MARAREERGTGAYQLRFIFAFSSGASPGVCSSKLLNASDAIGFIWGGSDQTVGMGTLFALFVVGS